MITQFLRVSALLALLMVGTTLVSAQDQQPSFEFEDEPHPSVGYAAFKWHPKDYGWLLTFRLTTPTKNGIRPITHLRFQAFNEAEELVWEGDKIVRSKDMSAVMAGGQSQFIRMLFKDLPQETALIRMTFDDGKGSEASQE